MSNISKYKTKDVYIASTLITLGYTKYQIERNGKQCFFIFIIDNEDAPEGFGPIDILEEDVEKYWNNALSVDPKRLFNSFKELKTRMFIGGEQ